MFLKVISGAGPDVYTELAEELYGLAANKPLPDKLPPVPESCISLIMHLYWGARHKVPPLEVRDFVPCRPVVSSNKVLVGATSGKDSVSVTSYFITKGACTTMVHVKGINPMYPHECEAARRIAETLGCEFYTVQVKIGKKLRIENPLRNTAILLLLTSVAAKLGAGKITLGLQDTFFAKDGNRFDSHWSDYHEVNCAGRDMLVGIAPWITQQVEGLPCRLDAACLKYLVDNRPNLLPLIRSCMQPLRFHAQIRRANYEKAGYELLPGRCGSCWKCCVEWLVLHKYKVYADAPVYERHVRSKLCEFAEELYGVEARNWSEDRKIAEYLNEG